MPEQFFFQTILPVDIDSLYQKGISTGLGKRLKSIRGEAWQRDTHLPPGPSNRASQR